MTAARENKSNLNAPRVLSDIDRERAEHAQRFAVKLGEHYFHAEMEFGDSSLKSYLDRNSVIFVGNHSGMNFSWDNFILFNKLKEHLGAAVPITPLAAPPLFDYAIMQPFAVPELWRYYCEKATSANFERLAMTTDNIFINPEGIAGISKGFNHKYELQTFSSSFVRFALKYKKDVVPIYTINGEYLNPYSYNFKSVNRIASKFGFPFFPIGISTLLVMIFPLTIYIALPARLKYVVGPRIDVSRLTEKNHDEMTQDDFRALAEKVRLVMQVELDRHVARLGDAKFAVSDWDDSIRKLGLKSYLLLPLVWPVLFHRGYLGKHTTRWQLVKSAYLCFTLMLPVLGWPLFILYLFVSGNSRRSKK